jgi:hypothetical protein
MLQGSTTQGNLRPLTELEKSLRGSAGQTYEDFIYNVWTLFNCE